MSNIADEIPEIPLVMNPQTDAAKAFIGFKWGGDSGGNHKIGGTPNWLQDEETPGCPYCDPKMAFIAQIDSVGDGLCFGDCGRVYLFMCRNCGEIATIMQCA